MCDAADESVGIATSPTARSHQAGLKTEGTTVLMPNARLLADWPERRTSHVGFVGYGNTAAAHKVLIAVDREYDPAVPHAIAEALREKGAHVDVLSVDLGQPTKEFDYLDEVRVTMAGALGK